MGQVGQFESVASVAQSTGSTALLVAGNTNPILAFGLWAAPAAGSGIHDARIAVANSTAAAAQLIAGTTAAGDDILLRSLFIAQSTVAGSITFRDGSSTSSVLATFNLVAGSSPFNGVLEFPGAGMRFASSQGAWYESTALTGISALYSTGVGAGQVSLYDGSSTGTAKVTIDFPPGARAQYIPFPQGGVIFNSTIGITLASTNMHGVSMPYST